MKPVWAWQGKKKNKKEKKNVNYTVANTLNTNKKKATTQMQ